MKVIYTKKEMERIERMSNKVSIAMNTPMAKMDVASLQEEANLTKCMKVTEDGDEVTIELESDFVIDCIDLYEGPTMKIVILIMLMKDTLTGIFNSFSEKLEDFTERWFKTDDDETEKKWWRSRGFWRRITTVSKNDSLLDLWSKLSFFFLKACWKIEKLRKTIP